MTPIPVLVQGLALLLMISGVYSSNSLTSIPSQVNGTVIAHVGDEISLTCSHSSVSSAITQWIISSPVNCSENVNHNNPTSARGRQCGPFMFQNITIAEADVTQLNSTAVATASTEISGSVVECKAGLRSSISVGNISLCVIDGLPEPVNLGCIDVSNGLSVTWDVATSDCAMSFITHNVTVVREADGTVIASMNDVKDNRIDIGTDSLEPSQNYSIRVSVNIVCGSACRETSKVAAIVCTTSGDLSPRTASTATPGMTTESASSRSSITVTIVTVVVVTMVFAIIIAIIVVALTVGIHKYKKSVENIKTARVEHPQHSETDEQLYTEILETDINLQIATHQNVAYLDIKSTRSNHNADVSRGRDSAARSALDHIAGPKEQFYTEIHEGDDISTSHNIAYLNLNPNPNPEHVNS